MLDTPRQIVLLETSSYLPLLWRTPYTRSVIQQMRGFAENCDFAIQADCIREGAGYLSFKENWQYHPSIRIRRLLAKLDDERLDGFGYPSAAIRLLLGGSIWPNPKYLNFVRHSAFFYSDLLDDIDFNNPRQSLLLLADRIDRRIGSFRRMFRKHEASTRIELPLRDILPYWGEWYLPEPPSPWEVAVLPDHRPYDSTRDSSRDAYHYDFAQSLTHRLKAMLVADTGFRRHAKKAFATLSAPIVCANTTSENPYE